MQHVQERMGVFTPRTLQLFPLPAFLMTICIFLNSYNPTAKWVNCIFPLYKLSRVHEQHIFLIWRVFHLLLGEWYMEGRGNFNSNWYISVQFDNTKCACEISLPLKQLLSSPRRHFPGFRFEKNIAALSCYREAAPGTKWQAKRGLNHSSTPPAF